MMQAAARVAPAVGAGRPRMQEASLVAASPSRYTSLSLLHLPATALRSPARLGAPWQFSALAIGRRVHISRNSARPFSVRANVTWVLEPIGDGDTKHLDAAIPRPAGFVLEADVATVGRIPEKVDIAIPVATVSGVHARLEKKGDALYVTDLDSTNGTFVDGKKIKPGAVTITPPNSSIVFGDEHLAAYRVSKKEDQPEPAPEPEPEEASSIEEEPATTP
eukprot:TRINITY_DN17351_c0_g1_i1.p1 TRINITY_DN17351_c0_g1~~TRINITY_DN17351_c0_g1_i1.p1  ORF type:complete len:220 (+),score=32.96 TRINITY_DN17351_c0_g1_i1:139-798(+)